MNDGLKTDVSGPSVPDSEVTPKAKRRSFSAPYKRKIVAEVEAAAGSGSIGEILRREGVILPR
jgi:transposase